MDPSLKKYRLSSMPRKCKVCGKKASKRCPQCLSVSYCSPECQNKDWKTHKLQCKPVSVHKAVDYMSTHESKGRRVIGGREMESREEGVYVRVDLDELKDPLGSDPLVLYYRQHGHIKKMCVLIFPYDRRDRVDQVISAFKAEDPKLVVTDMYGLDGRFSSKKQPSSSSSSTKTEKGTHYQSIFGVQRANIVIASVYTILHLEILDDVLDYQIFADPVTRKDVHDIEGDIQWGKENSDEWYWAIP